MPNYAKHLLRIPTALHKELKALADNENRSLTNYIVHVLEEHMSNKNQFTNESVIKEQVSSYDETVKFDTGLTKKEMEETADIVLKLLEERLNAMKNTSDDK
jgi:predicted DNA-binding protein